MIGGLLAIAVPTLFPTPFLLNRLEAVPRSVPVIPWWLPIVLPGGARFI
jgi:hypothetical protein